MHSTGSVYGNETRDWIVVAADSTPDTASAGNLAVEDEHEPLTPFELPTAVFGVVAAAAAGFFETTFCSN